MVTGSQSPPVEHRIAAVLVAAEALPYGVAAAATALFPGLGSGSEVNAGLFGTMLVASLLGASALYKARPWGRVTALVLALAGFWVAARASALPLAVRGGLAVWNAAVVGLLWRKRRP